MTKQKWLNKKGVDIVKEKVLGKFTHLIQPMLTTVQEAYFILKFNVRFVQVRVFFVTKYARLKLL
jgi:hypothetical protein